MQSHSPRDALGQMQITPTESRKLRPPMFFDTPIAKNETSTLLNNKAEGRYKRLAMEIQNYLIGPMPVDDFLCKFFPEALECLPSIKNAFKGVPLNPKLEGLMNKLMVCGIKAKMN